jgi:hypothetical protein
MRKAFTPQYCLLAALAVVAGTTPIHAQLSSSGTSQSTTGNSQLGTSGTGQNNTGGYKNPDDANSAIAPPFDVEDVLRMHRVGLQDDVIVNALRSRYHPLVLTDDDRASLKTGGICDRVIVAIEDPYGIGIQNVRANMDAANAEAPPIAQTAQQAMKADPKSPKLKTRPASDSADSAASGTGAVYVGQSHPDPAPVTVDSDTKSESDKLRAKPDVPASSVSSLDLSSARVTGIQPEPTTKLVSQPVGPGLYMRHGSQWERVGGEPVYWRHHGDKSIEGSILRPESSTQTYPGGTDFLVVTADETSAIQYQFIRLHVNDVQRTFKPAPPGGVYTAASSGDLLSFDPKKLGPSSWLISLHDVPAGEYGLLPPVTAQVHSTTNLSTTLYTFRIK